MSATTNAFVSFIIHVYPIAANAQAEDKRLARDIFYAESLNQSHLDLYQSLQARFGLENFPDESFEKDIKGFASQIGFLESAYRPLDFSNARQSRSDGDTKPSNTTSNTTNNLNKMKIYILWDYSQINDDRIELSLEDRYWINKVMQDLA